MNKQHTMNRNIVILCAFIIYVIVTYVFASRQASILLKYHKITNGVIVECKFLPKTGGDTKIFYQYIVNQKLVNDDRRSPLKDYKSAKKLIGKNFPVVYNDENSELSYLLITPQEFEKYGYTFPDSLNWVLKYIDGF